MRSFGITAASIALVGLAACDQTGDKADAAPAPAVQAAAPQPSQTMQETFVDCTWGETTGSGLSVWSYACPQSGNTRMVHDASLPGFALEGTYDGQTSRSPAIIIFKKAADAPIDAILPEVRTKSPGPHSAECVLTKVPGPEGDIYGFAPTGAAKAQWDAASSGAGEGPQVDAPCGDMGPQMSGDRGFRVLADDPTTVVFIEYGSEIQPFDPAMIRKIG